MGGERKKANSHSHSRWAQTNQAELARTMQHSSTTPRLSASPCSTPLSPHVPPAARPLLDDVSSTMLCSLHPYEHVAHGNYVADALQLEPTTQNQHPTPPQWPVPNPPTASAFTTSPHTSEQCSIAHDTPPAMQQPKPTTSQLSRKDHHHQSSPESATRCPEHSRSSPDQFQMQLRPPTPTSAVTIPPPSAGTLHAAINSTASTAPTNITPGARKWCKRCGKLFASGNHLRTARTI